MTTEQEIERIKKDFEADWPRLEALPAIQKAITDKNPVRLAELASKEVFGNVITRGPEKRRMFRNIKKLLSS
jgi:hypothetical protein